MFHHHDIAALLPDIDNAHMRQEDCRDKPPDEVFSGIPPQRRHPSKA
jgi:hypothetical protein